MDATLSSGSDATETSRETSSPSLLQRETCPHVRAIATRRVVKAVELASTGATPVKSLVASRNPAAAAAGPRCDPCQSCNSISKPRCAENTSEPPHQVLRGDHGIQTDLCEHSDVCMPRPNESHITGEDFCRKNVKKCDNSTSLFAGLLNVNSLDAEKFTACTNILKNQNMCWLALTELIKPSKDPTALDRFLSKHNSYPILTDNSCQRVGLMVPKYLEKKYSILEAKFFLQRRKQSCQKVCQIVTYKFETSNLLQHISVVYRAPDSDISTDEAILEYIKNTSDKYKNYIAVGDFNIDVKDAKNKKMLNVHLGHNLHQKVKDVTRIGKYRNKKGKVTTSQSIIDLIFLDDDINNKFVDVRILNGSPSDHFILVMNLDISVPSVYTVESYFLDPSRRPPIPKAKLGRVIEQLKTIIDRDLECIEDMTQSQIFEWIEDKLKSLLDKVCPLNSTEKVEKKIYRVPVSKEFRALKRKRIKILNRWRSKNSSDTENCVSLRNKLREITKELRKKFRQEEREYINNSIRKKLSGSKHIWEFINQSKLAKKPNLCPDSLVIAGKSKTDLANHLAQFLDARANLVPDEIAHAASGHIPLPTNVPIEPVEIDNLAEYTVKELYEHKKKPSLACGPDTISHRHIVDLLPQLSRVLQIAINKPIDKFPNISENFNRLILKVFSLKNLVEKSLRPIAELNILSKYGPIKIYFDQLRDKLIPYLNKNQFSFPGKGSQLAIVTVLDELNRLAVEGLPTFLVLWDYSNAFCTFLHEMALKIAKEFNLSEKTLCLFEQFLKQTTSTIKISDSGGFYFSDPSDTGRGGQQGQIGTDFVFALLNDGIQPMSFFGEFVRRIKYVDDFQDIMAHWNISELFESLLKNDELIRNQSASLAFKINGIKLKILAFHIPESEIHPAFKIVPGTDLLVRSEVDLTDAKTLKEAATLPPLLGLGFSKNPNKRSELKVWAMEGADNCLSRLNGCFPITAASRKVERNLINRLNVASSMIWSCCYDIGLIYCYVPTSKFNEISVRIRKLAKSAGLDQTTPREVVYKLTTSLSPELMAIKQIIQLGLKMANMEDLEKNRYLIKPKNTDNQRPFWKVFCLEFNRLPLTSRSFIVNNYDPLTKAKVQLIKNHLKGFYIKKQNNFGKLSKKSDIFRLAKKHAYSRAKVETRIFHAKTLTEKRKFSTPTAQRSRLSSISNTRTRTKRLIRAPDRITYTDHRLDPGTDPPEKRKKPCDSSTYRPTDTLCTPKKRQSEGTMSSTTAKKPRRI